MNSSHFPSLELCKRLTELGFPRTELGYRADTLMPCKGGWKNVAVIHRPSIAELLDELPMIHEDLGWFCVRPMAEGKWEVSYEFDTPDFIDTLPNALSQMRIWLGENNLLPKK